VVAQVGNWGQGAASAMGSLVGVTPADKLALAASAVASTAAIPVEGNVGAALAASAVAEKVAGAAAGAVTLTSISYC
jgi:hypothetical protein